MIVTVNHRLTWGTDTLNMADHRAVGLAVLDAARDAGNRWIFTDLLEEGLDPWNGVRFVCLSGSPVAGHAVDVTESIEKGVESLRQHEGYIKGLGQDFNPDAFLKDAASWAGAAMGVRYAVKLEMMNV